MNKFGVFLTLAIIGLAVAEPPISSGYAYSGPSISLGGGGGHGGGYAIGGGDSYSLGGGGGLGGISGGYTSVNSGYQSNEGQHVDPILLHKVKQILLEHENKEGSLLGGLGGGGHGGISLSYGAPSHSYGVPSNTYGVPHYGGRVVGIELGHIRPGIQVAQYHQSGYTSIPSGSYGVPSIPSGSYGVPSGSYGAPHH